MLTACMFADAEINGSLTLGSSKNGLILMPAASAGSFQPSIVSALGVLIRKFPPKFDLISNF